MSREIKFRAWDSEEKKMMLVESIDWANDLCTVNEGDNSITDHIEMFELMQFTGQKTKNNQDVYEGDIVKVGGLIEVVSYIDGILCCYSEDIYGSHEKVDIDDFESLIVTCSDFFEPYEVIGNIHETPELLK